MTPEGNQKGTLFLCATPIGNLEDITLRVLRVLREADLVAAEDTRHTAKLLGRYEIRTPVTSYHQHNRRGKGEYLVNLLENGKNIALVTDAGMPGISDPGEDIAVLALDRGIEVVPLPGPSASLTALAVSGLPAGRFCFEGFLPARGKTRSKQLETLHSEPRTIILYEAPHRLLATLRDLLAVLGNRRLCVARELTKLHEEVWRGTLEEALSKYREGPVRGEVTLVVEGLVVEGTGVLNIDHAAAAGLVEELEESGMHRREAIKEVAKRSGMTKREVYSAVLDKKKGGS